MASGKSLFIADTSENERFFRVKGAYCMHDFSGKNFVWKKKIDKRSNTILATVVSAKSK